MTAFPGLGACCRKVLYNGLRIANAGGDVKGLLCYHFLWLWVMDISNPILGFLTFMLELTNHSLCATNHLPGSICGSILNSVAAVVLATSSPLCRITELSA